MRVLDECHERGFVYKLFGNCNQAKRDVNMCLRAARLERTAKNREQAKKDRENIEKKWQDIDLNS